MKGLIVAGEASGDIYGSRLASLLVQRIPDLELYGMGGARMAGAGVQLLFDFTSISVVGVLEVVSKLRSLRSAFQILTEWAKRERPAFVILIDFPDFNFRLASFFKQQGIQIIYFISPQIWAWRKERIHFLKRNIDLMICVLPFEESIYQEAKVNVVYVGHPLVEIVKQERAHQPDFQKRSTPLIGIMPGSRDVEVRRHLPVLSDALMKIRKEKDLHAVLIWPPSLKSSSYVLPDGVEVVSEDRYAAMKSCDFMIVTSGTSTLESAILNVPMFIVYKVNPLSWLLGKALVRVPYYGLVNWIAGEKRIPEYIQKNMNAGLLAQDTLRFLNDPARQEKMKADLRNIVAKLGPEGAMDRAVNAILSVVGEGDRKK